MHPDPEDDRAGELLPSVSKDLAGERRCQHNEGRVLSTSSTISEFKRSETDQLEVHVHRRSHPTVPMPGSCICAWS